MTSFRKMLNKGLRSVGYEITEVASRRFAKLKNFQKAEIYIERYREIISDPLNLLIEKDPYAGYVDKNLVTLHNGNRVPIEGDLAYYKEFSDILIINRGVHEPLEEFCFQQMLKKLKKPSPLMLELGSYWAHYSMWLLKTHVSARCYMVEPDQTNIECGINNFKINNYKGEFIKSFVGKSSFQVDEFMREKAFDSLDILHSDIQGYEVEMLEGATGLLSRKGASYVFISTHSQQLHNNVEQVMSEFGYRIEVSSDFDRCTTSYDGFVLASSPDVEPVFGHFNPMGRTEIVSSTSSDLARFIASTAALASE
ncbi:FkbM family methyltransferase [Neorhizobium sp. CSC1952]|uniref:FkbM family methyltransferase n=1 Tax=Neorhizobium sp. CSC1952 TaxID=2978974 RepID=UPI0025A56059|nr:FkbM family methyltransferase [Rhizobium sp. CSC1952]WJR66045.1 FkbM family methyltransferase [Rhizobium sp. CSC1952]